MHTHKKTMMKMMMMIRPYVVSLVKVDRTGDRGEAFVSIWRL